MSPTLLDANDADWKRFQSSPPSDARKLQARKALATELNQLALRTVPTYLLDRVDRLLGLLAQTFYLTTALADVAVAYARFMVRTPVLRLCS